MSPRRPILELEMKQVLGVFALLIGVTWLSPAAAEFPSASAAADVQLSWTHLYWGSAPNMQSCRVTLSVATGVVAICITLAAWRRRRHSIVRR